MPRRKAEIEILPPEDQSARGRKKLVEAEHTIKYSAPVPVTVEEDPAEDSPEEDFDFIEAEKTQRRRKTAKDERDDLRRELDKLGVASVSRLKLSIDKYRHSDSDESGTLAEKDYCTKYPVTKDHIIQEEYMDVARRYGPGRYWFALRMDNKIVRQWERQINPAVSTTPIVQHVNPNDPTSPQVFIQSDGQQAAMPSIKDIMKVQREALKEQLEMAKLMREAYGFGPDQSANQPRSEEEILSSAILKQPEVIENVVGSVIKRFGGKGGGDDEPGWSTVVMEAVKNNQVAASIQAFGNIALMFLDRILPQRGNNNGQAPMEQAPLAQTQRSENPSQHHTSPDQFRESLPAQSQSQGSQSLVETGSNASPGQQQQITPEQHALSRLIENCQRRVPVQVAYQQLISYADAVNEQAPDYSIDGYIDLLGSMETDQVIEFVKTLPNGEQIASLEWAKEWTAGLQKLIKENQEGDE